MREIGRGAVGFPEAALESPNALLFSGRQATASDLASRVMSCSFDASIARHLYHRASALATSHSEHSAEPGLSEPCEGSSGNAIRARKLCAARPHATRRPPRLDREADRQARRQPEDR